MTSYISKFNDILFSAVTVALGMLLAFPSQNFAQGSNSNWRYATEEEEEMIAKGYVFFPALRVRIPENRMVFSCTTDGFLSNITDDEAAKCSSGVLCELYREQRKKLTGDDSVLEKKHYIKTPLGWRTRGQATLEAGVPHDPDGKHVLLAKGGIWTPPEYEELEDQNDEILNYFFDRTPDTEIEIEGKTESPRILRRLHTLRRWSHEQEIKPFFTRSARTRCPHGARTPRRVPISLGHH